MCVLSPLLKVLGSNLGTGAKTVVLSSVVRLKNDTNTRLEVAVNRNLLGETSGMFPSRTNLGGVERVSCVQKS